MTIVFVIVKLDRMAERLEQEQLRYPELERLKMLEENDQLGENEPEYDFMIMGVVFRDVMHTRACPGTYSYDVPGIHQPLYQEKQAQYLQDTSTKGVHCQGMLGMMT